MMMVLSAVTEQTAFVHGEPVAWQFAADIAGFGVMIEKKTVIGGDDDIVKLLVLEPVDRCPNPFQRIEHLAGRGFRVILEMAVDFDRAQHQQIDFQRQIFFAM
jgi:hypothetical protein